MTDQIRARLGVCRNLMIRDGKRAEPNLVMVMVQKELRGRYSVMVPLAVISM